MPKPISFEELRQAYREWQPSEDDDYDELVESCKVKAYCIHGLLYDQHPIEQMIAIAWLMAVFVDGFEKERRFDGLVAAAQDFLSDIERDREAGADAGANTSD